ncbi:MAG: hypothetical protein K6E97_05660 [Treponema sp.]|nr:hypothetical protein [Treponema sp.]
MKRFLLCFLFISVFLTLPLTKADAYMVKYKEDYYRLFHVHYQQYPDDCMENIYWLEKAVQADFCNPQFVDFKVVSEKQWEKYRYLFQMHLNLKLIEQHIRLGRIYDKYTIYFYDAPFKEQYLKNLDKCLSCYKAGLYYWKEAKLWYEKANAPSFYFLTITEKQGWEDERERIFTGELDYEKMLNREIKRVEKNIKQLNEMSEKY